MFKYSCMEVLTCSDYLICWTVSLAMHTNTYAMEKTSDRSDMKTLVCVHGQKEEKM